MCLQYPSFFLYNYSLLIFPRLGLFALLSPTVRLPSSSSSLSLFLLAGPPSLLRLPTLHTTNWLPLSSSSWSVSLLHPFSSSSFYPNSLLSPPLTHTHKVLHKSQSKTSSASSPSLLFSLLCLSSFTWNHKIIILLLPSPSCAYSITFPFTFRTSFALSPQLASHRKLLPLPLLFLFLFFHPHLLSRFLYCRHYLIFPLLYSQVPPPPPELSPCFFLS